MQLVNPVKEEEILAEYRDPDNLIEILSRGTETPMAICGTGLCRHEGTESCPRYHGMELNAPKCDGFELIDADKNGVESILLNALTADQHNTV